MAARATLNTTLEIGAVQMPVGLIKIKEGKETKFEWATPNGNPRKQQYVDAETGEHFPDADCQRGVRVADDLFRPIPAEALDAIAEETKIETFEVNNFMDAPDVPWERVLGTYYLAPQRGQDAAKKPMRLIYEALKASGRVGYFKLVLKTRQQPAVLYARNGGLYVSTLAWAEDFHRAKDAGEILQSVPQPEGKMLQMAMTLVESLEGSRDGLDALTDDYREKVAALYEQALNGEVIEVTAAEPKPKAEDTSLEKLLEASVAAAKKSAKKPARKKAAAAA